MIFAIVLVALFVQWFVNASNRFNHQGWLQSYLHWWRHQLASTNDWLRVIAIVLPAVFVCAVVGFILGHYWGMLGSFVLQLFVLWYCVGYDIVKHEVKADMNMDRVLVDAFQRIFVVLFWFGLFRLTGLVIYYLLLSMDTLLVEESDGPLKRKVQLLQWIMEWVPLRLFGFTLALVGRFSQTFTSVLQSLFNGKLDSQSQHVVNWSKMALDEEGDSSAGALQMIDRALLVWLVVFALVSIGAWVG